jgi:hypothetical protein
MTKPYHEMTPAERLADRIARNREIDKRVLDKKPAVTPSGRRAKSPSAAPVRSANNAFDKFQEIKRTQGIDAASDFVQNRIKASE